MKKYLFLFVTAVSLALFPGRAHAQRYLPGMKGVELRGGFANGSKFPLIIMPDLPFQDIPKEPTVGSSVPSI